MLHASNLSRNVEKSSRCTFLATCNAAIAVAKWRFKKTCNATFVALQVARKIASCNMAFTLKEISFSMRARPVCALMTRKSCAVGLRNAVQRNQLQYWVTQFCMYIQLWLDFKKSLASLVKNSGCRLRVVLLSLSPSCETRKEPARKNGRARSWGRDTRERRVPPFACFSPPGSRAAFFFSCELLSRLARQSMRKKDYS